jgi:hypothetical protein
MGLFSREPPPSPVEVMAKNTGWLVTSREDDIYWIRLGDGSRTHRLRIRYREDYFNTLFMASFPIRFPLASVTPELTMGLLVRNGQLPWAKWCLEVTGSCEATIYLYGSLATDSLGDVLFNTVCRSIFNEIEAVFLELQGQAGRLTGGGVTGQFRNLPQSGRGSLAADGRGMRMLD